MIFSYGKEVTLTVVNKVFELLKDAHALFAAHAVDEFHFVRFHFNPAYGEWGVGCDDECVTFRFL